MKRYIGHKPLAGGPLDIDQLGLECTAGEDYSQSEIL